MDLEDWELLPKHNYKDLDLDHDEAAMNMIDMDYFICPSTTQDPVPKTEVIHSVVPTQLLQIPITWEPVSTVDDTDHKKDPDPDFSDQEPELFPSPRITFKTMKENQFADMKIDQPAQNNESKHSGSEEKEEGGDLRSKKVIGWEGDNKSIADERLNLWKKGLNGIGAICSFGVAAAAATICVFFLGHNNNIRGCRNKNQILRFQIYSDDNKRMNEVVKHATKLNEVISVMKGLPVARAQISFGGYYDGL